MPSLLYKDEKTIGETDFINISASSSKNKVNKVKNQLSRDHITNKMALHLYVLGPLMKDKRELLAV